MFENRIKLGIVCCSDGQKIKYANKINILEKTLLSIGFQPVFSEFIYQKDNIFSGTAEERANAMMNFYADDDIKAIFDISGGDIANGVLPYLDYEVIANSSTMFWGYSDLTTIINALYAKAGKSSVLYQLRNLIYEHGTEQIEDFRKTMLDNKNDLFNFDYRFIQQKEMRGIVIGGNIRCFLKLAGTEFLPDFKDKILRLESRSGTVAQMETYLCQLQQLGAFDKVAGILLGTFTQMESEKCVPTIETLVQKFADKILPIAVTKEIGHGIDSKGIVIGQRLELVES